MYVYEDENKVIKEFVSEAALVTGPSRYCRINEFKDQYNKFDYLCFVLSENECSYKILSFIQNNIKWIKEKSVVVFYNSDIYQYKIGAYIKKIHELLGENIKYEDDFYFDINKVYSDKLEEKFIRYAAKIRDIIEADIKKYPKELLKRRIESFLEAHNTCTLCTSSNDMIIGTPIEYMYKDGNIYIITEGGRKFINILKNNNVSIAVYEEYSGFSNLNGLQLSGVATVINFDDDEYDDVIKMKKLEPNNIKKLNMIMNVVKVELYRATFLCSDIKKEGYDAKQVMMFHKID